MSGDLLNSVATYSTIGSNFITIFWWIWWLLTLFYFYWSKRYKAIIISSKTFQTPLEKEDISKAIYPRKISDETIKIDYNKDLQSPQDFCIQNITVLSTIKSNFNPICVFWIAEMFIFIWIWYYLQDSVHIRWFRKLKESYIKFLWNPWSWPSIFSLKWILYFKWLYKILSNSYKDNLIDVSSLEEVVLFLNISSNIDKDKIPWNLRNLKFIDFWIIKTDYSFLINESQVTTFSKKIKNIMFQLDQKLGWNWKIHIFWSLPVPFCIKLWQSIHRNWPECVIYEFDRETQEYFKAFSTRDFRI